MSKKNIVIIDYGLCNLLSVYNALKILGYDSMVTDHPAKMRDADYVILPGVGAFQKGMNGLKEKGFIEAIHEYLKTERPFLGICLGMQMLMTRSFEFGEHEGLGLIEGDVVAFRNRLTDGRYDFKVPHTGWSGLQKHHRHWEGTILGGLKDGEQMYFVHSFHPVPKYEHNVLARTLYADHEFCSVTSRDNVFGCQFHPEKSSQSGLKILENFVRL